MRFLVSRGKELGPVTIPEWDLTSSRGRVTTPKQFLEKSAQKIFRAADQMLRAGRPDKERAAEDAN